MRLSPTPKFIPSTCAAELCLSPGITEIITPGLLYNTYAYGSFCVLPYQTAGVRVFHITTHTEQRIPYPYHDFKSAELKLASFQAVQRCRVNRLDPYLACKRTNVLLSRDAEIFCTQLPPVTCPTENLLSTNIQLNL